MNGMQKKIGELIHTIQNSKNKASKARKDIKSMPEYLKGQEQGNMKATECVLSNKEKELLYQYEKTGLTPDQLEALLEKLKGECWLCEHSKPYDVSPTRKLSVCELHIRENIVAQIRDKGCEYWRLKQFGKES